MGTRNRMFLMIGLILLLSLPYSAQSSGTWTRYVNPSLKQIAAQDDYVWCATEIGVVRVDADDMGVRVFTKADGLPVIDIQDVALAPDGTPYFAFGSDTFADGYYSGTYGYLIFKNGVFSTSYIQSYYQYSYTMSKNQSITVRSDNVVLLRGPEIAGIPRAMTFDSDEDFLWSQDIWGVRVDSYDDPDYFFNRGLRNVFFMSDGLISNTVRTLVFDHTGYLWIGTEAGVSRMDTKRLSFTNFTEENTNGGLIDNMVYEIVVAADNAIWFATAKGVCRFDGQTWRSYPVDSIHGSPITLSISPNGTVWIGTDSNGIARLTDHGWEWVAWLGGDTTIGNNEVVQIEPDTGSGFWIRTATGISHLEGTSWTSYGTEIGVPTEEIVDMKIASNNHVWLITGTQVVKFDGVQWHVLDKGATFGNSTMKPLFLYTNDTGLVRLVTYYEGSYAKPAGGPPTFNSVWTYTGEQWIQSAQQRFTSVTGGLGLFSIAPDGGLWSEGALRYNEELTTWERIPPDVPDFGGSGVGNVISYTAESWVWTDRYVYRCGGDAWEEMLHPSTTINAVIATPDSSIWIGTGDGLSRFKGGVWTLYTEADGLADNTINSLYSARDGSLWVGTGAGISRFDGVSWQTFAPSEIGTDYPITAIAQSETGVMLFGTDGGGVVSYHGSDVGVTSSQVPAAFPTAIAYPNPFNPSTTIRFTVPRDGRVSVTVYSVTGQKVATLVDDRLTAGEHTIVFDGSNMASGLYFYRVETVSGTITGKMTMLR